jgi:hypothetical protein
MSLAPCEPHSSETSNQLHHIQVIAQQGRLAWQRITGYNLRNLCRACDATLQAHFRQHQPVERLRQTGLRQKCSIGATLLTQKIASQECEGVIIANLII